MAVLVQDSANVQVQCIRHCIEAMGSAKKAQKVVNKFFATCIVIAGPSRAFEFQRAVADADITSALRIATEVLQDKRSPHAIADLLNSLRKNQSKGGNLDYIQCLKAACDTQTLKQFEIAEAFMAALFRIILESNVEHALRQLLISSANAADGFVLEIQKHDEHKTRKTTKHRKA